jgi:hypothetical protein
MSFTLNKTGFLNNNGINVMLDYKHIAQEFCIEYYTLYDENVEKLKKMYHCDSKFIYMDHEFSGFDNWMSALKQNGYWKFNHKNMSVNVIPICDTNISINITGRVSINNMNEERFTENIMLQKDGYNNFYICTTMFKTLD